MPKGPRGERRPADVIGAAIMVGRIATGEIEDKKPPAKSAAAELGSKGGKARAKTLSKARRKEISKLGSAARWSKQKPRKAKAKP
jgi:hypothetical protein